MFLGGGELDVEKTGVRVLRVEDGVLIALRQRELQVELDGRVGRAQQIEVADCVAAKPTTNPAQGTKPAARLDILPPAPSAPPSFQVHNRVEVNPELSGSVPRS